jgi:hypothetical protein
MVAGPGRGRTGGRRTDVASNAESLSEDPNRSSNLPGTAVPVSEQTESRGAAPGPTGPDGNLVVSELVADRAAAPSPFGDDQTFPLPFEDLTYTPTTTP